MIPRVCTSSLSYKPLSYELAVGNSIYLQTEEGKNKTFQSAACRAGKIAQPYCHFQRHISKSPFMCYFDKNLVIIRRHYCNNFHGQGHKKSFHALSACFIPGTIYSNLELELTYGQNTCKS